MTAPITASLYAADGTTLVTALTGSLDRQWLDELNGTGSGQLKLPITDSAVASCAYDQVVRFTYSSGDRYAFRVEEMTWDVVGEPGSRFLTLTGRGLLAWLEDALLLPYGGTVLASSPDKRYFNFGSADSFSHSLGVTWATPVGVKWTARTDSVAGFPKDWPDKNAYWIWSSDPQTTVPSRTVNWFRKQFTLAADAICRVYATADDYLDVYVDGELMLSTVQEFAWKQTLHTDIALTAGTHVVAIRGQNHTASGYNPASVIASVVTLDSSGNPSTIVAHTDTSWQVSTTEPQWKAGDVLYTVFTEAKAFGWGELANMTVDFTASLDSNGAAWSTVVSREWDIVTTNLLTLALDLCDLGLDVWVTPDRVLHAAETRGTTKTVTLSSATNTSKYQIHGKRATATYGWVKSAAGWWGVQDSTGVAAWGKRGIGLTTGNTASDNSANQVAAAAFVVSAAPAEVVQGAEQVPVTGSVPYVDFNVGDTVTGLSKTGTGVAVRVLSLAMGEDSAGVVSVKPEYTL